MLPIVGRLRVLVAVALLCAPLSYAQIAFDPALLNQSPQAGAKLSAATSARVQGRNDEARKSYEDARQLFQVERNRLGEANALLGLGELERKLGRNDEARKHYEDAQRLYQAEKNRLGEGDVLLGLGDLERTLGRNDEARKRYKDALRLYQAVENRRGEAITLMGLGELERTLSRNDDARKNFRDAAIYFGLAGLPDEQRKAQALTTFSDVPVSEVTASSNVGWKSWKPWGAVALGALVAFVALSWWQGRQRATSTAPLSATIQAADAGKQWLHFRDNAATAVVFVHGILSNPSGFRFDEKTNWPGLLHIDPRANEPNIFLGQYYTAADTGIFDIPAASEELRVQLNSPTANGKPAPLKSERIVFIAHSTGGLVVRDLLTRHPELFKGKQVGLALIASPSRGSAWANRLSMFIDLANNRMARQLQKGNEWTDDLDKRFADFEYKTDEVRGFSIKGIDLFENRFVVGNYPIIRYLIPTRTVVVSERDSASYFGAGKIVPDTDHFTIARPSSLDHASHRYLMEWWVRCGW